MKIAVVSDTHGAVERLERLKEVFDGCDYLFFLGDGEKDMEKMRGMFKAQTVAVAGNNDFNTKLLGETVEEVEGTKFFLTHGHRYGVNTGVGELCCKAKTQGCKFALYGHTHHAFLGECDGVTVMNPGSLGLPFGAPPSYAIIESGADGLFAKIVYIMV